MKEPLHRYKVPQDVYARHLVSHRGYPLWIPELKIQLPKDYQDHGLKIGDVGYVVPEQGCFEVLFNIRLPLDHDLHRDKPLPRKFQPITLNEADIATYPDIEDAGCVISTSSVKTIEASPVEQPSDYKFTLSSSEGALLILPQGADQDSLLSDRLFGEYAKQHAAEWYRFVEEDLKRTISYDSLYLITGFYKAPSFALASFQEAEGSGDIDAQFKVTQLEGGGIDRGYRWSTTRALNKRVGPKRYNGKANQAVYISGFKIAVRAEPAGRKQILVKADDPSVQPRREEFTDTVDSQDPDELKDDRSTETTHTSQGSSMNQGTQRTIGHVSLQRIPQVSQPFHPSDTINRYLLRKDPSATVAITHDSQWATLLKSTKGWLEPHDLTEERLIVEALSEKYVIASQDGSVFLQSTTRARDTLSPDIEDQSRVRQDNSYGGVSGDHGVRWSRNIEKELVTTARPLMLSRPFDPHHASGTSSDIITSPRARAQPEMASLADVNYSDRPLQPPAIPIPSDKHTQDQVTTVGSSEQIKSAIAHFNSPLPPGSSSRRDGSHFHSSLEPPDLTPDIVKVANRCQEGGTFGDIYKCQYNSRSGLKEVALKVFRFKFALKDDANYRLVERRRRELEIWRRLSHGNIVPFLGIAHDFGRGGISLVSPWMQNGCLHRFLERYDERLSVAHRLQLLLDIANGLHYLHTFHLFPIVHGNLNANNVLLDEYCTARLAGFGNSSVVGNIPETLAYLQMPSVRPSTLRWTSPELLLETSDTYQTSTKSDIYSFGCISLQTLSGKQPWSEVQEDTTVIIRLTKGQPPGRPVSQRLDDRQWEFIQRCWSSVEDRPSSEMLVHSIQRILSHHSNPHPLRKTFASLSGDQVTSTPSSTLMSSFVPVPLADARRPPSVCLDDDMTESTDSESPMTLPIASGSDMAP